MGKIITSAFAVAFLSVLVSNPHEAVTEALAKQDAAKKQEMDQPMSETYTCNLSDDELRAKLSPEQFKVARQGGTERPFHNAYWDNKEPGIYVDIVSGEPLFSSIDKFDSGTGWPSFHKPIHEERVVEKKDRSHGMIRTEVRSKGADSHLGHVFPDGPGPTGERFCINSASLRFVHLNDLEKEGYGIYLSLFQSE